MHKRPCQTRTAFTLLEIIVVIMIMGVLASMIIPRLSGNQQREFKLTAEQVNDVVLMFAHRVSTSNQASGLRYNPESKQLELLSKIEDSETKGHFFWGIDPLAEPITIPQWLGDNPIIISVDGEVTDTSQWPVTTTPGETRPFIEVSLYWDEHEAIISLPSHAMGPSIWFDGIGTEPLMPIDLDAEGRGREEW
jgi:prepilin-type N-terminal cleavage/methylation domain-containing protein|tara:strand:+ start:851 stop:1429 length:579 start_codon:yes stop_codon:yes gene_type:complete